MINLKFDGIPHSITYYLYTLSMCRGRNEMCKLPLPITKWRFKICSQVMLSQLVKPKKKQHVLPAQLGFTFPKYIYKFNKQKTERDYKLYGKAWWFESNDHLITLSPAFMVKTNDNSYRCEIALLLWADIARTWHVYVCSGMVHTYVHKFTVMGIINDHQWVFSGLW